MEADLETFSGLFSRRLERQKQAKVWEGLQNSNMGLSQHNVDLWSFWGWISGRFGLQFGSVLGFMTAQEASKSGPKTMSKVKTKKERKNNYSGEGRRNGGGR